VVLLICSVTGMESVLVKIAPLAQNVTCAVKTSSILHQRDANRVTATREVPVHCNVI